MYVQYYTSLAFQFCIHTLTLTRLDTLPVVRKRMQMFHHHHHLPVAPLKTLLAQNLLVTCFTFPHHFLQLLAQRQSDIKPSS
jgi:hypothetical protein